MLAVLFLIDEFKALKYFSFLIFYIFLDFQNFPQ